MELKVTTDEVQVAWKCLVRAFRRHVNAYDELPSSLLVSAAGLVAIKYGALSGAEEEVNIILVEAFPPNTVLTVA